MIETEVIFYIKKFTYKTTNEIDLSAIPMMTRRRLSIVEKLAITVMSELLETSDVNLIFASKYGEIDRSLKLIEQYQMDNEVSPTEFGFSVHNTSASIFSILNKIQNSYNSISAGDRSFMVALLEGIISLDEKDSLICYADSDEANYSLGILISKSPQKDAQPILLKQETTNVDDLVAILRFLDKETNELNCGIYKLVRGTICD